uniref:ammonium transporter Rh type A-like n=1 Tax=Styela clava TaxID=7725 RepID=UPI001939B3F2|nr:ammonium transporter Rh type A-like [Styela clava]
MSNTRGKTTGFLLVLQALFMVFFGLFVDYDTGAAARNGNVTKTDGHGGHELADYYPMFQDVHVMMLIGFGFLMTFLKKHGFGSIGFNFLLTCYVIEWATLVNGWFGLIGSPSTKIHVNILTLLDADFAVATVLISFGAVLGKVSPIQLLIMATFEVVFYNLSFWVGVHVLGALDIGGSMFIHAFGAYFGLSVSRVLYKTHHTTNPKEGSEYHSDMFSMIGPLFLWLYWPSFNSAPALGNERHRAVINTTLSLAACTVVTFAVSSVTNKKNKLDMVHIQNATLAGGVAIGSSANLIIHPFGALMTGSLAGILSVLGFRYIQPTLQRVFKLHDTCGVHNLHGLPGILGAMISSVVCAVASVEVYNDSYPVVFPHNRSPGTQGGFQIAGVVTAIAIAMAGGAITGFFLKLPIWDKLLRAELYDDSSFWQVPEWGDDSSLAPSDGHEYKKVDDEEVKTSDPDSASLEEKPGLEEEDAALQQSTE